MEIIVCVKHILDTRLPVAIVDEGVVAQKEPWPVYVLNPADRCALEEAIRLRGEIGDCRVTAMTVGPARTKSALAHCLARGADKAVHLISDESARLDSFSVASLLNAELRTRDFDLVICGYKTEDDGAAEVGPVLAELLNIVQITNVVKLAIAPQDKTLVAERKLERGYRQVVSAGLPALVTVDSSICQPYYVTRRAARFSEKGMDANTTTVIVQDDTVLAFGPSVRQVTGVAPPRPRPKKIEQPDADMSAADRLAMAMGIGAPKKSTERATGDAEGLADDIISFLREKGLLP